MSRPGSSKTKPLLVLLMLLMAAPAPAAAAAAKSPEPLSWVPMEAYEHIRLALADGDAHRARYIAAEAVREGKHLVPTVNRRLRPFAESIYRDIEPLVYAPDLRTAREAFGALSRELIAFVATHPKHAWKVVTYRCKRVHGYAKWLQPKGDKPGNPYLGKRGRRCARRVPTRP